ncbi:MAG: hypothetical protein KC656_24555, partial [Myxococcales bacterium]|nr:hypothetical protein [Myxococcales bacterium]
MWALMAAAFAHGVGADQVVVQAQDDRLLVVATPRSSLFPFADDDGDGLLDRHEVARHREALDRAFDAGFRLETGMDGETYLADIVVPEAHAGHGEA